MMRTAARLLQVRPGEYRLVAFAALMFAAIQAAQGFGANTADALLFRRFGVESLPVMFMVLGGATFIVTVAYSAALSRAEPGRLSAGLLVAAATALIAARAATAFSGPGLYPVLWLLVGLTGALLGTLVWNVAGDLFDARQSKRLFPLFASAGILGGVAGNLTTGRLAQAVGTENLLFFDAGLLGVAALAVRFLRSDRTTAARAVGSASVASQLRAGHDYVVRSRLMRLTAAAGILFSILFFSISYPFSRAVAAAFPDEAELAGYLGGFSAFATAATFIVSSLLAGRLYARIGVVNSVLILPAVYLAGFALWLVRFDLGTAAAVRFAQLTVLGGVAGTAYSALFNVVPPDKRSLVRTYQAGIPSQLGVILSGGLLWLGQRGLEERSLFAAGIGVALVCGYLVLQTRRAYGQSLVDSLKSGLVDVFTGASRDLRGLAADAQARSAAASALRDARPAVRRIAAEVLGKMQAREQADALADACRDPDPDVRRAALRALTLIGMPSSAVLQECLRDADGAVRAEGVRAMASMAEVPQAAFVDLLADHDPVVQAEAAAAALQRGENGRAARVLEHLTTSPDPGEQLAGTKALGRLARAEDGPRLEHALASGPRAIRLAAIEGLGTRGDGLASHLLLQTMDDNDPVVRRAAARAYATSALDAAPLVDALVHGSDRLQDSALEALAGKMDTGRDRVVDWTLGQIPKAHDRRRMAAGLRAAPGEDGRSPAVDTLRTVLEREEWRLEQRVLTALSLLGGAEAMAYVSRALRSFDPGLRSQALEALDTLGEKRITRALLPLLESPDEGDRSDSAAILRRLTTHPRAWVRSLAFWAIAEAVDRQKLEWIRQVGEDRDPVVRALLERIPIARLGADGGSRMDTSPTLTTMERVLFLRQVPLFAQLEPEDLQQLAEISTERMYEPEDVLVREGDLGDELFVIVEGAVRVGKQSEAGERVLRRLGPGDHLGELAILREQPRSATAVADGQRVRTLALKGQALTAILDERPAVGRALLSSLAERLSTLG